MEVKGDSHGEKAIVTIKTNLSGTTMFEPSLCPRVEDVAVFENSLGRDDGFHGIFTVEAKLPVRRAVGKLERKMIEDEMCPVECGPRASQRGSRGEARREEVRREEVRLCGHREV